MRYVPRQPRDDINVSKTHPLAEAGTLVVGLSAIFLILVLCLVFLVELVLFFVPAEREAAFFRDWLPDDLVTVSPADERLHQAQLLVDRLVFHWADSPYEFRVEINDADNANAMALPGGLIIVTSGLLDKVQSENELAFVLGHELGHYKSRDHIRGLGRGLALALVFAVTTGRDVSSLGIQIADLTLRGFSRKQELVADEFGLAMVYTHYGHVNDAWRLFERWGDDDVLTYFSTHPQSSDRIERLEDLSEQQGWPQRGRITDLSWK